MGLFFSLSAMAQPTNYTKINMRYRWLSGMFDSALYVPRYNGTPSGVRVNETSAIDGMIAMDTTNNRLYIYSGGSWIRLAAYSEITAYTAGNGLTLSGSQFKLGGTLTENTTIDANNNILSINNLSSLFLETINGRIISLDEPDEILISQSVTGYNNSLLSLYDGGVTIRNLKDLRENELSVVADSIHFKPSLGQLNIDSLRTWSGISDTTHKKPMTWDTRNGRWEYANSWFGGGGTYTAGSGLTLSGSQFKLGGTLTENATINGNNLYKLNFYQVDTIGFSSNSNNNVLNFQNDYAELRVISGLTLTSGSDGITLNTASTSNPIILSHLPSGASTDSVLVYTGSTGQVKKRNASAFTAVNLVFGAGSGADADTTAFTTSAIYGSFYNDADTIVVTSMRGVLQGSSPNITYQVWYNDSLNVEAGGTKLVTAGNALTNTTTGTNVTSFDVTKIPPGNWVWVKTGTVAVKPKYFSLTINGYRK